MQQLGCVFSMEMLISVDLNFKVVILEISEDPILNWFPPFSFLPITSHKLLIESVGIYLGPSKFKMCSLPVYNYGECIQTWYMHILWMCTNNVWLLLICRKLFWNVSKFSCSKSKGEWLFNNQKIYGHSNFQVSVMGYIGISLSNCIF